MEQKSLLSFFQKPASAITQNMNNEHQKEKLLPTKLPQKNANEGCKTNGGKRKFQEKWCNEFEWLLYENDTASCKICSKYPGIADSTSKIVRGFQGPFKLETFKIHQKSKTHKNCMDHDTAISKPECTPLALCRKKMDEAMFSHLQKLFNTAYYIAKFNKPFTDFENLIALLNKFDVNVCLEQYQNYTKCREFIFHIADVIRQDLIEQIKQCKHVTILLDSSTDNSTVEELIIYVRYIKNKKVKEDFLSVVPLQSSTTSESYYKALDEEMKNLGIDWLAEQWLVGIGTDGAANMIGKENGLTAKIKRNLTDIVSQHCIAHRLNLSVLSSIKNVKYLEELDSVLKSVYKFYGNSPKRMGQLSNIAEILQLKLLKFQYLHKVRWVSSKIGALTALVNNYNAVITHLENVTNEKGNDASTAKGIIKKMKNFRFVLMLHFLLDFLLIFKELSLIFQKEELLFSQVNFHIKQSLNDLKQLESSPASYESHFKNTVTVSGNYSGIQLTNIDTTAFESDRMKMISDGTAYLHERFIDSDTELKKACSVFDTFTWPKENLEDFGKPEIEILTKHYQKHIFSHTKISWELNLKAVFKEWYEFKVLGQDLKMEDLLQNTLTNQLRFPFLSHLLEIVAVLPTSTASCERGFSHMNLIKTDIRSSMEASALNDLMMIHLNGPPLNDYEPQKAIDKWFFGSKKTRHTEGHMPVTKKQKTEE